MFRWENVRIAALAVELPSERVDTASLEARLTPLYRKLHIPRGYIARLSGIRERRWWPAGTPPSFGAVRAARKALQQAGIAARQIETLHYAGVCREHFEPATACRVAAELGVGGAVQVYDVSNACLGVLNSMVSIANQIELRQISCGLVVACESARPITEKMMAAMLQRSEMEFFSHTIGVLTGGSGAVAVLLSHQERVPQNVPSLRGGVAGSDPQFYRLCHWGVDAQGTETLVLDSIALLQHGMDISARTFAHFLRHFDLSTTQIDKVVCHQVSDKHNRSVLELLQLPAAKAFNTYATLGNIGAVSLPLTAALAAQDGFLKGHDFVALLGIGSGFNTIMLGVEWATR